jgi:membrane protein DedA with SNARE-associated domain
VAGFTPIPYNVFTIASGVFGLSFIPFVVISSISRGLRFFILGAILFKFGESIKIFIERYFNLLSILFVILLILGYVGIKFFI